MKNHARFTSLLLCFLLLLPLLCGLFSCAAKPATENRVTSVTLDGERIQVEATLTKGFLENYALKKVYLFELPLAHGDEADLTDLDPVAEANVRGELQFTIPLFDGLRTRLYSSFLVASFDPATSAYIPLTPLAALSNPQSLAPADKTERVDKNSIKGLISDYPADAIRLGVSHTVVDVFMEKLILSTWREGAVSYVYNGVTRYLDADTLTELDKTVGLYTAAGVEVYLRFILGDPTHTDVPTGLYFPNATESGAADYAVNMTTPFSALIMEGFFDFMADRYANPADGRVAVNAFVLGRGINNSVATNNAAGLSLSAYITNYEKLTRLAYMAIASHNAEGRVYIALDGRRTVSDGNGWDTTAFLAAFAEEVSLRGDYGWHVACELYANTPTLWEDDPSTDTACFTIRNLGVLTGLLDSPVYCLGGQSGEPRRLLISSFSIPAVTKGGSASSDNDIKQAASYVFAYLTCVQNGRVEALIYDTHIDPAPTAENSSLEGLWTVAPDSGSNHSFHPAATRPIYNVFWKIDTTDAAELSPALTDVMGSSYTKLANALTGKVAAISYLKSMGTLQHYTADHSKASPLFLFTNGDTQGFTDAGSLTYLELVNSESLGLNTLHARFDRDAICQPMGLTVTLPASSLIGGREMILDLYGGLLGTTDSETNPTVTLRLIRASKGSIADGAGEIRYEASVSEIKSGSWQTVSFDISTFTDLLDADDEVTVTLLMDYPIDAAQNGPTAHHLGLAGVYVLGPTASTGISKGVVVVIMVVLGILVAGMTAVLFIRHRQNSR